ncbi:chaperone TorD involved in molybdoenzyme TorA maturation [Paenibacillus sophorae]|uniref:Chaperone TorD involved in molybdoenzyme TorA maturation n=1 Tax=Paenibacillus sophorae TaxID=1333845 RepID=A0A1H8IDQ7_9BACL|nr:molecular chaperone TorD family protein [Paenibacillus sophorae]QWU15926.1 molecular chaperone TorD family protein [Paenibacillus sophorae]SEN66277.1 chaperone TorD involved in molybdoenzyme TorA maturation [Paenibacillus sophorae]
MTTMTVPTLDVSEAFNRWLESRGFIYQLFSDFFGRRPTLSLIAQWSRNRQIGAAAEMSEGGRELKRYLHSQNPHDLLKVCEKEAAEYDRLMRDETVIGLKPREAALLGEAEEFCNVISDVYASAGIVFKKCGDEADDHIAIEMEFMAVLHDRMLYNSFSARSALEQLSTQENFLKEHLLLWAPEFCERLNSATDSPLYRGLSRMLEEFLPYDLQMLQSWKASLESTAAAM